ncbi:PRC-barrel domain containing protein [Candidatus Parcubacteria bacterium]|nr:MAG: PRC-barrel domain containing protein [Candidatus Parcubacteria bacterium]
MSLKNKHMVLENQDLINLPVYTKSGRFLGRINHFEIDEGSQSIIRYFVKSGLIQNLWKKQLIIHRSQVISITKEKMTVDDSAHALEEKVIRLATSPSK